MWNVPLTCSSSKLSWDKQDFHHTLIQTSLLTFNLNIDLKALWSSTNSAAATYISAVTKPEAKAFGNE